MRLAVFVRVRTARHDCFCSPPHCHRCHSLREKAEQQSGILIQPQWRTGMETSELIAVIGPVCRLRHGCRYRTRYLLRCRPRCEFSSTQYVFRSRFFNNASSREVSLGSQPFMQGLMACIKIRTLKIVIVLSIYRISHPKLICISKYRTGKPGFRERYQHACCGQ